MSGDRADGSVLLMEIADRLIAGQAVFASGLAFPFGVGR
jgi:hypothetical protein